MISIFEWMKKKRQQGFSNFVNPIFQEKKEKKITNGYHFWFGNWKKAAAATKSNTIIKCQHPAHVLSALIYFRLKIETIEKVKSEK